MWKGGVDGSTCSEGFENIPDLTPEEHDILNKLREKEAKIIGARSVQLKPVGKVEAPSEKYKKNMDVVKNK